MVWEIMGAQEEQMFVTGMHLLFDMKDFTMSHFTNMPLSIVKKLKPCWEVIHLYKFPIISNYLMNFIAGRFADTAQDYELYSHAVHLQHCQ